ncbi:hypothetical protein E4656_07425 [Natronospirillum operosum]|uniref:Outer membrane lipoprotein-sorting protein n=1 Tax=Natronospirillum operosum TaxID=2759953 RepID=A0A4Z0WFS4_9GAMM|nr:hypothetical protein [Natronospirillum operosum]TGG94001.1 hypothetical protein E4656_07425 [Natronospirillum operosum]
MMPPTLMLLYQRYARTLLCAAGLGLATGALADASTVDRDALAARIQAQYDTIDRVMLEQPYWTRSVVRDRHDDRRTEITSFHPERAPGDREQLELVNGAPPDSTAQRRFERRTQPDERDQQPLRLTIDYDTLEVLHQSGQDVHFSFAPQLLMDGEISPESQNFTGQLVWDLEQELLRTVSMQLTTPFSYRFFNVEKFTVEETFRWLDGRIVRADYGHDITLRNRLIDLSNAAHVEFDYNAAWLLLPQGSLDSRHR